MRQQTQLELVNTLEQVGVTCIMVTHDQEEAMTMATRIAIMSDGQLQQVGTPSDVYDYPNSRFTAEFIGETNIFDGVVIEIMPTMPLSNAKVWKTTSVSTMVWVARASRIFGLVFDQRILIYIKKTRIFGRLQLGERHGKRNCLFGQLRHIPYQTRQRARRQSQVPAPYWYVRNITPPTWDETVYISWPENQPTPLFR
ncbi:Spermidine/putrescine ABC transporter, ATP-binding protein [Neisseria gonorrhoeae]|uniref:Spermidine/putrescine ABC transporter, ATP-binding protein n=1 Tax=Neisseria gonorrhoeae TaxID=485 RepID=A0A378W1E8_NEIGO|nr:Spermidine/putrescine ABC transporter, ATP-binding protein [Neisseria gonorrhoeae]